VSPKIVAAWRHRAAVESPSHLRAHPPELLCTLLAALLHEREVIDTLVDVLIATVHRIGARAERKVTDELVNAFKRVTGKEIILLQLAQASLARPDGALREAVSPQWPVVSRRCVSWCMSTARRARCIAGRCRRR
jgi:hypothetical protein